MSENPYESPRSENNSPYIKWYWIAGDIAFIALPIILLVVALVVEPRNQPLIPGSLSADLYDTTLIKATFKHQWAVFVPAILWCSARMIFSRKIGWT